MATRILLGLFDWILDFLRVYYPHSRLLQTFEDSLHRLLEKIKSGTTDTIKRYTSLILLWLAFDYIMVACLIERYLGTPMKVFLTLGMILFLVSIYFFIPKSFFAISNDKTKNAVRILLPYSGFFLIGAFLIPSLPLNGPEYAHISDALKIAMQNFLFASFFVLACVSTSLLIISVSFGGLIYINYHGSNIVCEGIRKFSAHCLIQESEPYDVIKLWLSFPVLAAIIEVIFFSLGS